MREPLSLNKGNNNMSSSNRRDVIIEMEQSTTFLKDIMSDNLFMASECCILRAPAILKRHNPKAYEPDGFSIGPFHHIFEPRRPTEKIKAKYLNGILSRSRSSSSNSKIQLTELTRAIAMIEKEARLCYAGEINASSSQLISILVLDGCFLIELFRKNASENLRDSDDPIFHMSCMLQYLYHDLILLENQIPWMVLEKLFYMTCDPQDDRSLVELAISFFNNMFSTEGSKLNPELIKNEDNKIKHILDLLRNWLILPDQQPKQQPKQKPKQQPKQQPEQQPKQQPEQQPKQQRWEHMPSATKLKQAGVKFKRGRENWTILDIQFREKDGVLEIPPLLIQETTEVIFRNLISYEQCYPDCPPIFTSYAILLDNLINTEVDLEILCDNDIFDTWLNPAEAAQFFNKLYHDTFIKESYYLDLCQKVNKYCQKCWPRNRTVLQIEYLKTPWKFLSTVAAILVVTFTFLQTLYAMK